MEKITPVVKQLLVINILFFVGSQFVDAKLGAGVANDLFAMHYLESDKFEWWQPLTHMFMHGGIGHIFFNMFALYSFGSTLEHFWGGKRFLFFYISCGLGAVLVQSTINYLQLQQTLAEAASLNLSVDTLHQIVNINFVEGNRFVPEIFKNNLQTILEKTNQWNLITQSSYNALFNSALQIYSSMLGASGAVYGLLIAFAFMFPQAQLGLMFIPVPIPAKYFVPAIVALDVFLGLKGDSLFGGGGTGVAHFAHVGGAFFGFLIMWSWRKNKFDHKRWN